jgi:hypothetical protein
VRVMIDREIAGGNLAHSKPREERSSEGVMGRMRRMGKSAGETPTVATETVALPRKHSYLNTTLTTNLN